MTRRSATPQRQGESAMTMPAGALCAAGWRTLRVRLCHGAILLLLGGLSLAAAAGDSATQVPPSPGEPVAMAAAALQSEPAQSEPAPSVPAQSLPTETAPVLEVYVRADCPHCAAAKQYLPQLQQQYPQLQIRLRAVDADADARDALLFHAKRAQLWPPGVPLFVIGDWVSLGFESAEITGPALQTMIDAALAGQRPAATAAEVDSLMGTLRLETLGLPLFTLALGLLDGFNPCAMWVLLFLLSLLVHMNDRRRMALVAGCFVAVSGAVYYLFMAAWLNVFLLVGWSRGLQQVLAGIALLIGLLNLKDAIVPGRGPSLHIPDAAKPSLYARMRRILATRETAAALLGVSVLAVIVNVIELLCTAGLPALYTAVLAQQPLSTAAHYGYLALYIAGYIADDSLMVATAVWALHRAKLSERGGRWLKLISAVVMLSLGLVMLWHPEWLR